VIAPVNRAALDRGLAVSLDALRGGARGVPLRSATRLLGLAGFSSVTALGRLADDVIAPDHRHVPIESPWLVVAPPRSGTTLLFDLLAQDPRFSAMKMYESMFPAASIHRAFAAIARLDPVTGGALSSLLAEMNQRFLAPVDPVHRSRLDEHEEDVPIFMPLLVDGSAQSALPFYDKIPEMRFLDDQPAALQDTVMEFYASSIQRFLLQAPGRTYLAKNVHSGGRVRALRRAFPDMRMIHVVRHPYQVIPTAIQLAQTFWTRGNPGVPARPDAPEWQAFGFGVMDLYRRLLRAEREEPAELFCTVRFDELVREPRRVVEHLYRRFDTPIDEAFSRRLDAAVAGRDRHKSARPFTLADVGMSRETIHRELYEVFEAYGFQP
jgi:hypothetical protein